ncbi:beta-glucosidase [Panacagrimonas perspica]|nr:beta-glucosidase [Panacagrimonas perspica]
MLLGLSDEALMDRVQRQTFRFFWEGAQASSGLARDRIPAFSHSPEDQVAIGGAGFGVMALIVAAERGWVSRDVAVNRVGEMLEVLLRAERYHGAYPHFMDGRTGASIPFWGKDDAADIVETSLLLQGLLCAREYFDRDEPREVAIRSRISGIWETVEWDWFTRGTDVLFWHWSPRHGWGMNHPIHGWNECLITYLLAASSPTHPIAPEVYHHGYASGPDFLNGKAYHGIELPLGQPYGGPLFFSHYSFCGLDPRGLKDRYADYWDLCVRHVQINREHCVHNPNGHAGYGAECWGITASDDPDGYDAHAPANDNGTISPTAAISSMPYAPHEAMQAMRGFLSRHGTKVWREFGFVDAFSEKRGWFADTFLAIDQGPIVVMIENHRSGLLWNLFMRVPEVREGLRRLGFSSPHLDGSPVA